MRCIEEAAMKLKGYANDTGSFGSYWDLSDQSIVRGAVMEQGVLWSLVKTAHPDNIASVLQRTLSHETGLRGITLGSVCSIIHDIIKHRPRDAVQLFHTFEKLLLQAKNFGNAVENVVRCWEAVCASGPDGLRVIESSDALIELFIIRAGYGANSRGSSQARDVINHYFARVSKIYGILVLTHTRPDIEGDVGALINTARMRRSLWDVADGRALCLIAQTVIRAPNTALFQEAIGVLKVKFARSILILHRARLPWKIIRMVKDFFPTWHTFYGVAAPVAVVPPSEQNFSPATAVLQDVVHDEPPAERDEHVLQLQADEDWAASVEQSLHDPSIARSTKSASDDAAECNVESAHEEVHLLRFGSGDGELFRQALLHGPQFRTHRDAMETSGYAHVHASQAIILVRPEQYGDVIAALEPYELHPFHVVITASFEYLVDEILGTFPSRRRPREKASQRQTLTNAQTSAQTASSQPSAKEAEEDSSACEFIQKRTFICVAPKYKEPNTVVQSTTEAVNSSSSLSVVDHMSNLAMPSSSYYKHSRGINPRRVV